MIKTEETPDRYIVYSRNKRGLRYILEFLIILIAFVSLFMIIMGAMIGFDRQPSFYFPLLIAFIIAEGIVVMLRIVLKSKVKKEIYFIVDNKGFCDYSRRRGPHSFYAWRSIENVLLENDAMPGLKAPSVLIIRLKTEDGSGIFKDVRIPLFYAEGDVKTAVQKAAEYLKEYGEKKN